MNALRLRVRLQLVLRQERVYLDLIYCRNHLPRLGQRLQSLHTEVADPNSLRLAALVHLLHSRPRIIDSRVLVRLQSLVIYDSLWPVHEIQIDVVKAEIGERRVERLGYFIVI